MSLDRRTWLTTTTAVGVSLAIKAEARDQDALPIVDTHQHLWDLSKFNLPWLGKEGDLSKSFVTKDYLAATEGLDIVKAVYMEVDVAEDQKEKEAEHIVALAKQKDQPTVAAVIGCRPLSADFPKYAKKFADQPL